MLPSHCKNVGQVGNRAVVAFTRQKRCQAIVSDKAQLQLQVQALQVEVASQAGAGDAAKSLYKN